MSIFEKFDHRKYRVYKEESITITKTGMFNFNVAAMLHYVKENKYAILFFNKIDSLIGIKLTNIEAPDSYLIRKSRNGNFGSISGIAFLNYYKISHETTEPYTVKWDENEQMLVLDLKQRQK